MPLVSGFYYSTFEGGRRDCPWIILIHGAGSTHLCWPAQLRRLNNCNILAPDLPGHGRSTGIGFQSIRAYAHRFLEFLDAVGIYGAVLVGHSMGGAIALTLARLAPERVLGLGLISSGAYLAVPLEIVENLSSASSLPLALQVLRDRLFSARTPPDIIQKTMAAMQKIRPGVLYADWRACSEFDLRSEVEQIHVPTWIAVGAEDQLTPVSFARFLVTRMPRACLEVIQDAGHMVILEQPEQVGRGLRQFLFDLYPNGSK